VSSDLREHLERALSSTYAFERELRSGGISLVFVAEERALGRRVVVKVLRPELSNSLSGERFRREIQLVARLQHPHIVPILHAGEADGFLYFTMPYVDGESLRHCLQRSGELPVARVAQILHDVCGALAYAHRRGVVHRDIKPENVLLSDDRAVVTDFGIAKAIAAARTNEPITVSTLTSQGIAVGTPAYMAPEQAAGDSSVDHRADLYALGIVAYELLVGRPPFEERTQQALLAAHAIQEPEHVSKRRRSTPRELSDLVMRCLQKRPADRPQSAEEVLQVLDGVVKTPPHVGTLDLPRRRPLIKRAFGPEHRLTAAISAVVLATIAIVGVALRRPSELRGDGGVRRYEVALPDSAPLVFVGAAGLGIGRTALALSPDGSTLAYIARVGGTTMLYLRNLSTNATRAVEESKGAFGPFFSPDSRWVAFFAGTELKRVSVSGGRALTLAQVGQLSAGAWGEDGRIYILGGPGGPLSWIPESGGVAHSLSASSGRLTNPQYLGGGWLLGNRRIIRRIALLDLRSGTHFIVGRDRMIPGDSVPQRVGLEASDAVLGFSARYVESGHLVFSSSGEDGVLLAFPFDVARRRVLGPPVPVLEGVRHEGEDGSAQWSAAKDGTLAYAPGANAGLTRLVWRDRAGHIDTLAFPRADYGEIRLSPDGRFVLAAVWPPGASGERWLLDLVRGTSTKVTELPTGAFAVVTWWPDGKSFVLDYRAPAEKEEGSIRWWPATGEVDTLLVGKRIWEVSPDSQWFTTKAEIGGLPSELVRAGSRAQSIPAGGWAFSFSPDGKWAAFTSPAAGQSDVYVAPLPSLKPRHKISVGGGEEPIWSRRGDEIVYRSGQRWFAVKVSTRGQLSSGSPRFLFEGPYANTPGWSHALSPDGRRHLLMMGPVEETTTRVNIVTNWFSQLRRLAPRR
jgi:tRNA A-37 threonylcarbamoyl transferase component Bud32